MADLNGVPIIHITRLVREPTFVDEIQLACPNCGCPVTTLGSVGVTRLSVISTCIHCDCQYETLGPGMVQAIRPGASGKLWVPST